ncbi:MAG: proline dehydrogenase [Calditrichaeota bacterium]|nr:MAG: proline dehydrogenase [Calditrichota bacterium]
MGLFNKAIAHTLPAVPKPIIGIFAKPYIAGERLSDAVDVVKRLMAEGCCATIDVLGEEVTEKEHALDAVEIYKQVLQRINTEKLDANISLKPTHMGLKLSKEFCYNNIKTLAETARLYQNSLCIDMEDHTTTTDTLEIYRRLRKDYDNVGTVLQAYLRRTISDINNLIPLRPNLRICKGIYLEPHSLAYHDKEIIRLNFSYALEKLFINNCYVCIATHDERLVWEALRLIDKYKIPKDRYEFQMLLGVEVDLRKIIVREGHRLRVYVPFGQEWKAYSTRRLKENPHIVGYVIQNIFSKDSRNQRS